MRTWPGSATTDRSPPTATLATLHRAHIARIPFENLDIPLGRGIAVDLPSVQRKLVVARRGGYCYEHGVLFSAVLQRLGFRVDRLLARMGDPLIEPRPRSHMVLRVAEGDRVWLADVGFGSGLLEPIPLVENEPHRQGVWDLRLMTGADGAWRLQEMRGGDWTTLMTFTEEPQYPVDVEVANYNTSTNPASPFVRRGIVVRKDETSVRSLVGHELSEERPGRPDHKRRIPGDRLGAVLRDDFGLRLSDTEITMLDGYGDD
ncbi:arylamine N-acetyltransferase [Dactylosporangium sp. NPDC048998]|uniref:arylamine N-acetyltransferase family protein n=1 Tax=Dactylosporangium sp. NPDC048998 TaxID=3363976 RepID=UPI0037176919